tara:strand:- start:58 stop:2163 length:2106 start_codon:yes stop_codon:yes gene_type:complete
MREELGLLTDEGEKKPPTREDVETVNTVILRLRNFYQALRGALVFREMRGDGGAEVAARLVALLFRELFEWGGNPQRPGQAVFSSFIRVLGSDKAGELKHSSVLVGAALALLEELQEAALVHFHDGIPYTIKSGVAPLKSEVPGKIYDTNSLIIFAYKNYPTFKPEFPGTPDPHCFRKIIAKLNVYTYSACSLLTVESRIRVVTSPTVNFPTYFHDGREEYKIINGCTVFNIYRSFAAERYEKNLHTAGLFNFTPRENTDAKSLYAPKCSTNETHLFHSDNVATFVLFNYLSQRIGRVYELYCSRVKNALKLLDKDLWRHIMPDDTSFEHERYRPVRQDVVRVVSDMQGLHGDGDLLHKRLRFIEWRLLMQEAEKKIEKKPVAVHTLENGPQDYLPGPEDYLPVNICQVPFASMLVKELQKTENSAVFVNAEDFCTWPAVSQTCAYACWYSFRSDFSEIKSDSDVASYMTLVSEILDDTHLRSTLNMSKDCADKVGTWKRGWLRWLQSQNQAGKHIDHEGPEFQTMFWTCVIFSCVYPFQPISQTPTPYLKQKMSFVREMTFSILSANILANVPGFVVDQRWKSARPHYFERSRLEEIRTDLKPVDVSNVREISYGLYEVFDDELQLREHDKLQYSDGGEHFLLTRTSPNDPEPDAKRSQRLYRLADTCVYLIDAYLNSENQYGVVYIAYLMRAIKVFLPM